MLKSNTVQHSTCQCENHTHTGRLQRLISPSIKRKLGPVTPLRLTSSCRCWIWLHRLWLSSYPAVSSRQRLHTNYLAISGSKYCQGALVLWRRLSHFPVVLVYHFHTRTSAQNLHDADMYRVPALSWKTFPRTFPGLFQSDRQVITPHPNTPSAPLVEKCSFARFFLVLYKIVSILIPLPSPKVWFKHVQSMAVTYLWNNLLHA